VCDCPEAFVAVGPAQARCGVVRKVRETRAAAEVAQALETARSEKLVASLFGEETDRIMVGFPGGSRKIWLKNYWRMHMREA